MTDPSPSLGAESRPRIVEPLVAGIRRCKGVAGRFWRDQRGAEGLEKLLIIAFIVLPLLALLIFFRDDIREWLQSSWNEVKGEAGDFNPDL